MSAVRPVSLPSSTASPTIRWPSDLFRAERRSSGPDLPRLRDGAEPAPPSASSMHSNYDSCPSARALKMAVAAEVLERAAIIYP